MRIETSRRDADVVAVGCRAGVVVVASAIDDDRKGSTRATIRLSGDEASSLAGKIGLAAGESRGGSDAAMRSIIERWYGSVADRDDELRVMVSDAMTADRLHLAAILTLCAAVDEVDETTAAAVAVVVDGMLAAAIAGDDDD